MSDKNNKYEYEHTWSLEVQMNHKEDTVANCIQVHQYSPCHCCKEYLSSSQNLFKRQLQLNLLN